MDGVQHGAPEFFISRTGADAERATEVAAVLVEAGYRVLIQDRDFANKSFLDQMDQGLASGARLIAILSPGYLATDYCAAEWMGALAGDPLNRKARLIVMRVAACAPRGLLRTIAYWDLVPHHANPALRAEIIRNAVLPHAERTLAVKPGVHWHPPGALLHDAVREVPSFTGRWGELLALDNQLWHRRARAAAITQSVDKASAAVTGLGGIGKSTLARQYGWEAQGDYAGIWWLNAEKRGAEVWAEVEQGLVTLGDIYMPGLARVADRAGAAKHTLQFLEGGGFTKPWLLIFDNVDDPKVLDHWAPRQGAHLLVTSRLASLGRGVATVDIKAWALPDAVDYLLAEWERPDLTADDARRIAEELGRLPLALSHAAAYLRDNTAATAPSYIAALSSHMREAPPDVAYDRAVFATFVEAMAQADARVAGAAALLTLAAFFGPDEIPEELFTQEPSLYPEGLRAVVGDGVRLEKALGALDRLSLIEFAPATRTFSVHRVVQAVARDRLEAERMDWAERAAAVMFAAFPETTGDNRAAQSRLVPHVRDVGTHVSLERATREWAWVLTEAGTYSQERASLAETRPLFEAALAIISRLAKADPGNAGWQRDLSVSHEKIGDVLVDQGQLGPALGAFRDSLAIAERLARADPGNAGWQRDLSVSHNKVGDVLVAQGQLGPALAAFRDGLAIRERLARADPGNAGWQRDLSVSHDKIGRLLEKNGRLAEALPHYEADLAIAERLAKLDPENAQWQRDVEISRQRMQRLRRGN